MWVHGFNSGPQTFHNMLTFLVLLLSLLWLETQPVVQQVLVTPFTAFLATLSASIIMPFDASALAHGNIIFNRHTGFGVAILPGCNAVDACIILVSAILAFPAPWQKRFIGIIFGILAIQFLNIARIISLFYIAQWNEVAFEIAHTYLWQVLIMLDVLIVWLIWMSWVARPRQAKEDDST